MKRFSKYILGLASLLVLANATTTAQAAETHSFKDSAGRTVKIPNDLEKIVVDTYPDEALALGQNVVGTSQWDAGNPYISKAQKKVLKDLGAPMNAEKIAAQKPDLIVTIQKDEVSKYEKIAPTVYVEYNSIKGLDETLDYFAKVYDAQDAKKTFLKKFDQEADKQIAKLEKADITPSDATISLIELSGDKIYAYGNNWARGGQALTRGLGFKQSKGMQALSDGDGWKEINAESLADFDADYIFVDFAEADKAQYEKLQENPIWQTLKAVKANQVVTMDYADVYYYGGPIASKALMGKYTQAILDLN